MADIVDAGVRSRMMAGIKGSNTRPELLVRRYLFRCGLRYRLHVRGLAGRPDLVFPGLRTVVFVHGCFWHRHSGCRFAAVPSTRRDFWNEKFAANVARDLRVSHELRASGWKVLTIWECMTADPLALDRLFWQTVAPSCSDLGDVTGDGG